ncbi:MAG: hypothetical protein ACREX8_11085, partial [Gammaproteobacteria bacterium]
WLRDELAADAAEHGIAIFSIALGDQADVLLLHALAQKTEGDYFRAERAEDLAAVLDEIESALLSRATPPVPKVAEEPAPAPSAPEPVAGAEPGPAELPTAPEITAPVAPEAVPPAAPVPSFPPSVPLDPGPAPDGLPERLAPWLIGFSVFLAFLAFVAARILIWVKKAAQAPQGAGLASATHEALPKAFLHDLSGTTSWKRHRYP